MDTKIEYLARTAYNAYSNTRGWKAFNGDALPEYDGLPEKIKDGWRASAQAILTAQNVVGVGERDDDFEGGSFCTDGKRFTVGKAVYEVDGVTYYSATTEPCDCEECKAPSWQTYDSETAEDVYEGGAK